MTALAVKNAFSGVASENKESSQNRDAFFLKNRQKILEFQIQIYLDAV